MTKITIRIASPTRENNRRSRAGGNPETEVRLDARLREHNLDLFLRGLLRFHPRDRFRFFLVAGRA